MLKRILTTIVIASCAAFFSGCTTPGITPAASINHFLEKHALAPSSDLWQTISAGFNLPYETPHYSDVRTQINWFMKRPAYLKAISDQAAPYLYYIYQEVKKRNLPTELTLLPIIESAYDPFAYSCVGAVGLWQMMPGTASGFGVKVDWWYDGRRDVIASTNAALNYFEYLGQFFHGNWILAIAAYNVGEGTVQRAVQYNLKHHKPTDFWHLPLPKETKAYVIKLLALATIIKYPSDFPMDLPPIKNAPYFEKVSIDSQIDLTRAAKMADVSLEELASLNPGFNRWATDPQGPHYLAIPINHVAHFKYCLTHLSKQNRVTWIRYQVKSGDVLGSIAKRFNTKITLIAEVNALSHHQIFVGQKLLIPISASKLTHIVSSFQRKYFMQNHHIPTVDTTYYLIKKGDSLAHIARQYRVTPRQIRFWNGLKKYQPLPIGKRLIIWPPDKRTIYLKVPLKYTVQNGDFLNQIAKHYNITAEEIMITNNLQSNALKPGQQLVLLPPGLFKKIIHTYRYTVKPGDVLGKIAEQFQISVERIQADNHLKDALIHPDQVLLIHINTENKKAFLPPQKPNTKTTKPIKKVAKKIVTKAPKPLIKKTKRTIKKIKVIRYQIQSGDILSKIAHRYHITTKEIMEHNHIKNENEIKPGQVILL